MFDTYIFDLYGTLVDIHTNEQNPYLWKKLALFMTLQGVSYTPVELKKAFRQEIEAQRQQNLSAALCENLSVNLTEIEVDISKVILSLYQKKQPDSNKPDFLSHKSIHFCTDIQIRDWAILFRTLSLQHLSLFEGAKELLLTLKQKEKHIYLLSNAQRLFTEPEMRSLGIYDLFDDILYSSDIGFVKPSSHFYDALIRKHNIATDHAVMIGNDDQADNWGASRAGMCSYYIQTAQSPKLIHPLPDNCTRIYQLSEITRSLS